jgi:putative nucleotidyltransferase with HDIG domain
MAATADRRFNQTSNRASFTGLELRVPPMPRTLTEALAMMEHSDRMDLTEVTEMVQRDPVVVARLLNIVNSAYYGLRHQVTSVDRAVVMLGPIAVAGIIVGMQMMKLRELIEGPAGQCFNRLIRHSVATAFLTRHLVDGSPRERRQRSTRVGPAFTAGLLHDFGKIILVYNFPGKAVSLYDERSLAGQVHIGSDVDAEQLVFGYDHTEAGEYVARKLNFPELLVDVVRHHHEVDLSACRPETDRMVRAVSAASAAASALGYAFTSELTPRELLDAPAWHRIVEARGPGATTDQLLDEIRELRPDLDEYVLAMTVTPDIPRPIARRGTVKSQAWNQR